MTFDISSFERLGSSTLDKKSRIEKSIEQQLQTMFVGVANLGDTFGRSTKKTNIINAAVVNAISIAIGETGFDFREHFEFEKPHQTTQKTNRIKTIPNFNVDATIQHASEKEETTIVLLKAPIFSISKNNQNNFNNYIGEVNRVYKGEQNLEKDIVFIDLKPKKTFFTKGTELGVETPNYFDLNKEMENSIVPSHLKSKIKCISIVYEINFMNPENINEVFPLEKIKNKEQMKNVINFHIANGLGFIKIVSGVQDIIEYGNYLHQRFCKIEKMKNKIPLNYNYQVTFPVTKANPKPLIKTELPLSKSNSWIY